MSDSILEKVRDEIMPAVLAAQTSDVKLKVYIENRADAIIVAGRNDKLGRELGFAITHAGIIDGEYRTILPQVLRQLVYMLEYSPEDEYNIAAGTDPGRWLIH